MIRRDRALEVGIFREPDDEQVEEVRFEDGRVALPTPGGVIVVHPGAEGHVEFKPWQESA